MRKERIKEIERFKQLLLPPTYQQLILEWTELSPLLDAFQHRDYGTFMHSMAVHFTATKLTNDLKLLLDNSHASQKLPSNIWQEINNRSPFWMLHDIGKTAADKNMETAHSNIFPLDEDIRSNYQKAKHWIHPQMSGSLIKLWAKNTSDKTKLHAQKWAQLSYLHDRLLNQFLVGGQNGYLNFEDKLSLFMFSICDTTMAMGLPRPNKTIKYSDNKIRAALVRKYLSNQQLKELFPHQNQSQIKNYILVSVLDSLNTLKQNYPKEIWTNSPTKADQEKTELIDNLVVQGWQECEQLWDATIMRMDLKNSF